MKAVLLAVVLVAVVYSADEKKSEKKEEEIRTFTRLIPADVLRDFPGSCFASTRCATIEPGETWSLSPFCGRSTCVLTKDGRLLELVEDCGPLPLPNKACIIDLEKTNKTADFPYCCPDFKCEEGVTLKYPDLPPVPGIVQEDAPTSSSSSTEKSKH